MTALHIADEHPLLGACAVIEEALDQVAGVDPAYASPRAKNVALVTLTELSARLEGLRLRVLASADDLAEAEGARSAAAWLAHHLPIDAAAASRAGKLAVALDRTWHATGEALREGRVSVEQAHVIVHALRELPTDLGSDGLARAEEILIKEAANLTPQQLRRLGRGILAHVAPEVADDHERKRLEDEEARAATQTRMTIRRRGDGTTDIHARVPDHIGVRLQRYLHAYTNPRRARDGQQHDEGRPTSGDPTPFIRNGGQLDPATGERLPYDRLLGEAFGTLLEALPTDVLPSHGGTTTQIIITLDHETLTGQLDAAGMLDHDTPITAGQARRLACQAGILPAVLGSKSEVLDLGRTRRLHTPAQRKAHALRHPTCQAAGCEVPWTWCESHHRQPWATGGTTDLDQLEFLCPWHHHRTHDSTYTTTRHRDGTLTYHRRA